MRTTLITTTVVALLGGSVACAAPASATRALPPPATPAQQWVQAFERPSADAPCIPSASLDIPWQADWPVDENVWAPSWEEWANHGAGGWTCTRTITWAPASYAEIMY